MSELSQIHQTLLSIKEDIGELRSDVTTIKTRGTALEGSVRELELDQARAAGRSSVISMIAGTVAGIVTAVATVVFRQLFGAPAA